MSTLTQENQEVKQEPKLNDLEVLVLQSLAYFDVFSVPLTLEQIKQFLSGAKAEEPEIFSALEDLRDKRLVVRRANLYALYGREEILVAWKLKQDQSKATWRKIRRQAFLFQLVPYIKSVMLCNNLPFNNMTKDSDIDVFIVVKEGRMWITRLMLSGLLNLFGVRRTKDRVSQCYCLSFFVTESQLNLEKLAIKPYDIYLAHWVRQVIPLTGYGVYRQFQAENNWVSDYLPNFTDFHKKEAVVPAYFSRGFAWCLEKFLELTYLGNLADSLAKKWLHPRALAKQSQLGPEASTIISDQIQKFHNHDRRRYFRDQFELRLKGLGILNS